MVVSVTVPTVDMRAPEPAFWDVQLSATVGSEQGECGTMAFCLRSF